MILDFCKGIALLIDDKALPKPDEVEDLVVKLIQKIRNEGIPLCVFTNLTDAQKAIHNFINVSFLILDWDMQGKLNIDIADDIIKPSQANKVIKFIKEFKKICFCPIFIFSNAGVKDIKAKLKDQGLFFDEDKKNFIHVQFKKDLIKRNKLFTVINKWVNENPTNYTLKKWENSFSQAKTDTFWHLFSKSPIWPKVMWESFSEDSVDPHSNLNNIIHKLIKSRTSLTSLDSSKINRRKFPVNHEEIKEVIQGMMFLVNKNIPENDISPGDIFKKRRNYFINIRPECDTVIEREEYDGKIYLLKGSKISNPQFKKNHYKAKYGIIPSHTNFLLYGLDGKDFVRFNLKDLYVMDLEEVRATRICRLLSPYINDIQQQYSSYIGRIGLPRIPNRVLKGIK